MLNPQFIKDYVTEKLECDYRLSSNNQELMLPSLFIEGDYKRHMSINLESGLWQCFKTGNTGNFIKLYSLVEGISYRAAESKLLFQGLESGMWNIWEEERKNTPPTENKSYSLDTSGFIPVNIESYDSNNQLVVRAWKFLMDRRLLNTKEFIEEPYYVSTEGKYRGRLIIPFKDYDNEIFFFQGRSLMHSVTPKYLNPNTENGVKSSNILYPFDFEADHLCICEGPSDAISLNLNGLNATCTVGSTISNVQMQTLREFEGKIILTYDNDEAGRRGVDKFEALRKKYMMPSFYICTPPAKYKDWNEAHAQKEDLYEWMMEKSYEHNFENATLKLL
jgi:5S rRNA maturation endonuclease (ribonuclease M5)